MMQSCVRYVLFGATIVAATAAAADSSARRGEEASFSSLVDAGGNITFPAHFPSGYVHIGSLFSYVIGYIFQYNRTRWIRLKFISTVDNAGTVFQLVITVK